MIARQMTQTEDLFASGKDRSRVWVYVWHYGRFRTSLGKRVKRGVCDWGPILGTSMHCLWNDFTLMTHIPHIGNHNLGFNRQRDGRKIIIYATLWLAKRGREMRIFGKNAGGFTKQTCVHQKLQVCSLQIFETNMKKAILKGHSQEYKPLALYLIAGKNFWAMI